jgi:hypothetical protein
VQFHVAYTDTRNTRRDGINEVNWWESMGSSLRDILLLSAPKGKYANHTHSHKRELHNNQDYQSVRNETVRPG